MNTDSKQVSGNHYKVLAIQPWEIIEKNNLNFWEGNILKYLLRHKGNRIDDLEKAKHYIEKLIEIESTKETANQSKERIDPQYDPLQIKGFMKSGMVYKG